MCALCRHCLSTEREIAKVERLTTQSIPRCITCDAYIWLVIACLRLSVFSIILRPEKGLYAP
ncbi:uncharacterized protein BO97DRAFT_112234 [Aspergillus homomorphus CBS 101889]|uniref:Uncharacterized protein n=1 Tax=Aspergillus homomorphus (strain CBS 101889) TaxID=1450537 RepID=A0A395HU44_ASPHC|nr:hypothetical protein BO97DRAFT_112234 [Aspergillus homomorphus CBS 101889]RAL11066.1 hypothetical protein BO97DRAFT_112234 [Aspergillus homomorphus CBS 101889]